MKKPFAISLASFALSGCAGPYFYKYADPPSNEGYSEVAVKMLVTNTVPQGAYFLNGESCSELRDLQLSKERTSRTVLAPAGKWASFHIHGLVSTKITQIPMPNLPGKMELTTCGNQVVSFPVESGVKYQLLYRELPEGCSLSLYGDRSGVVKDITKELIQRKFSFADSPTPSSSFCKDQIGAKSTNG